jgi:hypothetical protein
LVYIFLITRLIYIFVIFRRFLVPISCPSITKSDLRSSKIKRLNLDKKHFKSYHPIPWRDSMSRPIAPPVSSVAGGDDTTRPRRQGETYSVTVGRPYLLRLDRTANQSESDQRVICVCRKPGAFCDGNSLLANRREHQYSFGRT